MKSNKNITISNGKLLRDCYVTECYEAKKPQNKGKGARE